MEIHFQDSNKKTGRSMDQESIPELMESSKSEKNSTIISTDDNNSLLVAANSSSSPVAASWTSQVARTIRVPAISSAPDEYSWRKYHQIDIRGSPYPMHYYRCTNKYLSGCPAMKKVQRAADDPTMLIVTYMGKHNHTAPPEMQEKGESPPQQLPPQPQQLPPPGLVAATSLNSENNSTITSTNDNNSIYVATIRAPAISSNVADIPPDDGFSWKKYIQKDILGSSYPRHYYSCINRFSGCEAMKEVERAPDDPTMLIVTYRGEHNPVLHANDAIQKKLAQYKGECPPQQLLPQPQQLLPPGATQ